MNQISKRLRMHLCEKECDICVLKKLNYTESIYAIINSDRLFSDSLFIGFHVLITNIPNNINVNI